MSLIGRHIQIIMKMKKKNDTECPQFSTTNYVVVPGNTDQWLPNKKIEAEYYWLPNKFVEIHL